MLAKNRVTEKNIEKPNKIYCILSYFNFVFRQRRDRQEAFFGDIFPQKAELQDRSQRAFRSECLSDPTVCQS